MAMSKGAVVVVVVVIVMTFATLSHSRKELGSPGGNKRRVKPRKTHRNMTHSTEVTTEGVPVTNIPKADFEVITEIANTSSAPGGNVAEGDEEQEQVEEEQETTAISTIQPGEDEPTLIGWIYARIMHAIDSYSRSDSLWDWITGLGGGEDSTSTKAAATSRLYDIKFSPQAYEIVHYLERYGFKPYPDPYEPIYLDKDDIWKFTINWLIAFGILSVFWRGYDLPLPFGLYEKFGIEPPRLEALREQYQREQEQKKREEEEEEEEEDEEEDPHGEEEEEEEEEDDPYGEGEEEEEEEEDPYGEDEEEAEEDNDEDNYYKVGEEEKEREHESFAVFRQKNPDGDDDDDDDGDDDNRYFADEIDDDGMEMQDDDMNDDGMDTDYGYEDDTEDGVSSYTFYNTPGEMNDNERETEHGMSEEESRQNMNTNDSTQEEQESTHTFYSASNENRRKDQYQTRPHQPQTRQGVRRPSKKTSGTRQRPQTPKTKKRRVQGESQSSLTSRPPSRLSHGNIPIRRPPVSNIRRSPPPPPGVVAPLNSGKGRGRRPALLNNVPIKRPGNVLRRLATRPPPSPPSSSSVFPFSWFE